MQLRTVQSVLTELKHSGSACLCIDDLPLPRHRPVIHWDILSNFTCLGQCSSSNAPTRLLINEAIRVRLFILPPLPAGADNCGDYIASAYTSILHVCINFLCHSYCLIYTRTCFILFSCYIDCIRSRDGIKERCWSASGLWLVTVHGSLILWTSRIDKLFRLT
jgi:hypothetical protein